MVLKNCNRFIFGILILNLQFITSKGQENVIYSCCHVQNTFNKSTCTSVNHAESEFSFVTHQEVWKIPPEFRKEEEVSSNFELLLVTRPKGGKTLSCEVKKFHYEKNPGQGLPSGDVREQEQVQTSGENETVTAAHPKFDRNGTMYWNGNSFRREEYCFDSLYHLGDETKFDIVILSNSKCGKHVNNLLFPSSFYHPHEKWIRDVFAAVAGLSCIFTLAISIIYLRLRNYLNVSGWTEFGYFIALLLFNTFSIPGLLLEGDVKDHELYCFISSVLVHFFEIATFSSYFMVSFDLYWMLRRSDSFASYGEEVEEISKCKLALYYFTMLSFPIGLITYGLILDQHYSESEDSSNLIYSKYCLSPKWQLSEYLLFSLESITFIFVLLCLNHILGRLSKSADVDDAPRVSLLSNMLLFTLSYWVIDLLKFARPMFLPRHHHHLNDEFNLELDSQTFWIILDGLGYAQGIWVFIVFAFNRKTLRAFKLKSGREATLREIFRHACCGTNANMIGDKEEDEMPMSPLMQTMKSASMRRSTVRQNHLY